LEKRLAEMTTQGGAGGGSDNEEGTAASSDDRLVTETVGIDQIAEVIARWTGVPVSKLKTSERERLLNLEGSLKQRVVGQVQYLRELRRCSTCVSCAQTLYTGICVAGSVLYSLSLCRCEAITCDCVCCVHVRAQDVAVAAVARAVLRSRAGLSRCVPRCHIFLYSV
jgi:ATP-dependent Clp protease ATP-binding subunit ClpA